MGRNTGLLVHCIEYSAISRPMPAVSAGCYLDGFAPQPKAVRQPPYIGAPIFRGRCARSDRHRHIPTAWIS